MEKIQDQMEFLLSAALRRCGNVQDAEDLAQETILAALQYEAKGKHIDRIRPWLAAVMNRKYCDMLRRRYRQPFISMGEDFDLACEFAVPDDLRTMDEAECARREIAFLTATYREVMVRHYMEGQDVAGIAEALGIPEGTVKSRLSAGRNHVKKGMDDMEYYERQSYKPVRLSVTNSGCSGVNREPGSLVEGQLMKRNGGRLYTDFIIYTKQDQERYIPAQKEFIADHFKEIWKPFENCWNSLGETKYYGQLSGEKRNAREWFCFFNIFDRGLYQAFSDAFEARQVFPDRPAASV